MSLGISTAGYRNRVSTKILSTLLLRAPLDIIKRHVKIVIATSTIRRVVTRLIDDLVCRQSTLCDQLFPQRKFRNWLRMRNRLGKKARTEWKIENCMHILQARMSTVNDYLYRAILMCHSLRTGLSRRYSYNRSPLIYIVARR